MKIMIKNRLLLLLLVAFSAMIYSSDAQQVTRARREKVTLSRHDAQILEKALEHIVERAPRLDAPDVSDPDYPIDGMELDEIRKILCDLKDQIQKNCDKIEDLQVDVSALDIMMDFDHELICSKIDVIDQDLEMHDQTICSKLEPIGDFGEEAWDFGPCLDKNCIDDSRGTIIQWLKTILWIMTGSLPAGTCPPDQCFPIQMQPMP